ncbi:hypothetical protein T439DRAFT_356540 [Meredithblackwellia eburnea MCA 4105]
MAARPTSDNVDPFMAGPANPGYDTDIASPPATAFSGSQAAMSAPHGSRGQAPLLSRGSGRTGVTTTSGTSGSKYQPWYLRTAFIVLFIVVLLVALALGVGLGVGLTRDGNKSSSKAVGGAGPGGANNATGISTVTEETTVAGSLTVVPSIVTNQGANVTRVQTVTSAGITVTETASGGGGSTISNIITISTTVEPTTVTVTTIASLVTGTTTLTQGGAGGTTTITQTFTSTIFRTVSAGAGGGRRPLRKREVSS